MKIRHKLLLFAIPLVCLALHAYSAASQMLSEADQYKYEYDRSEKIMHYVYSKLCGFYADPEESKVLDAFKKSQQAWIEYRDCQIEVELYPLYKNVKRYVVMTDLTDERIHRMEYMLQLMVSEEPMAGDDGYSLRARTIQQEITQFREALLKEPIASEPRGLE